MPFITSETNPVEGPLKQATYRRYRDQLVRLMNSYVTGSGGAFGDHVEGVNTVVGMMDDDISDSSTEAFVYLFQRSAVGMMLGYTMEDHFYITEIVSHPGASGAGGALIEKAVQRSCESGSLGVVKLYSLENAKTAYHAIGFTEYGQNANRLKLDPSTSNLWVAENGTYRLSKYQNHTYATGGLVKPLPALPPRPGPARQNPPQVATPLPPLPLPPTGGNGQ